MLARPGDRIAVHHRAGVDAQHVVVQHLAARERHLARRGIESGRLAHDKARLGRTGQPRERNAAIVELVVAGDQARHHGRIDEVIERRHQRDLASAPDESRRWRGPALCREQAITGGPIVSGQGHQGRSGPAPGRLR